MTERDRQSVIEALEETQAIIEGQADAAVAKNAASHRKTVLLSALIALIVVGLICGFAAISCSRPSDDGAADPIVGSWKILGVFKKENTRLGVPVSVSGDPHVEITFSKDGTAIWTSSNGASKAQSSWSKVGEGDKGPLYEVKFADGSVQSIQMKLAKSEQDKDEIIRDYGSDDLVMRYYRFA